MFYYGVGARVVMGGLNKCIVCVDKRNFCLSLNYSHCSLLPPPSPSHFVLLNKPLLLIVLYHEDCAFIFISNSLHNWDAVLLYLGPNKVTQRKQCSLLL